MRSQPLPPPGEPGEPTPLPAGLHAHWQGRTHYTLLQHGFGRGDAFLALCAQWRAQAPPAARLRVIAIEPQPVAREAVAPALRPVWPPRTPDLHTLDLAGGITLHLAFGPLAIWLPELVATVDAFALPAPMPQALRLAAPGALGLGVLPPQPLRPPPGRATLARCAHVAIVGAGLAGAGAAQALARRGVRVTVLERADAPARATSGNPAGLFHGVVHAHDGAHAQLLRAAALAAARHYAPLVAAGCVPGAVNGLARLTPDPAARTNRHALPADWAEPLTAEQTAVRLGTPVAHGAWWLACGGWVSPPALVRQWLVTPGVTLHTQAAITRLARDAAGWHLSAADGRHWTADAVVLAGAQDGLALLQGWCDEPLAVTGCQRGQITWLPAGHGLPQPAHPVASGAYALALPDGRWLCGATGQRGDADPTVRAADHALNLSRAAALLGLPPPDASAALGRVGWRLTTDDRLPLLGPVPLPAAQRQSAHRQQQPRHVPRQSGLYVMTALGSRGLTWTPLLAEQLAAWICGDPWPLPASLVDALDAARLVSRQARHDTKG